MTQRRFFYHKGYWYYQEGSDDSAPVVSYQLADNNYYKSFNGKPVAFAPGEVDALLQMIPLYFQAIQKDLYRRD